MSDVVGKRRHSAVHLYRQTAGVPRLHLRL